MTRVCKPPQEDSGKSPSKKQKVDDAVRAPAHVKKPTPQKSATVTKPKTAAKGPSPKKPPKSAAKAKAGKSSKAKVVDSDSNDSDSNGSESEYLGQQVPAVIHSQYYWTLARRSHNQASLSTRICWYWGCTKSKAASLHSLSSAASLKKIS